MAVVVTFRWQSQNYLLFSPLKIKFANKMDIVTSNLKFHSVVLRELFFPSGFIQNPG